MITWVLLNITLSLIALVFITSNKTAPCRLRFQVCFITLCCWLIPWNSLKGLFPNFGLSSVPEIYFQNTTPIQSASISVNEAVTNTSTGWVPSPMLFFYLLLIIGFALFLLSVFRHFRLINELNQNAKCGNHLWSILSTFNNSNGSPKPRPEIKLQQNIPGALGTGLFNSTIWIHEDLVDDQNLEAVLLHEFKHIQNYDNFYLWGITFIEKLFWWNPMIFFLGSKTRKFQELSCDESCAIELPAYRSMLGKLILRLSQAKSKTDAQAFCSMMFTEPNFNVERIRLLQRRNTMKIKHVISSLLLVASSFFAISWGTAQTNIEDNADNTSKETVYKDYSMLAEGVGSLIASIPNGSIHGFIRNKGENVKYRGNVFAEITDAGDIIYRDQMVGTWNSETFIKFTESEYRFVDIEYFAETFSSIAFTKLDDSSWLNRDGYAP